MTIQIDLLVHLLGVGAFLWLGFFILTRADRQRAQTVLTVFALFSVAALFFGLGLINNSTPGSQPLFTRVFWWTDVLPPALWYHITFNIYRRVHKPLFTPSTVVIYLIALVLIVLGMFSDWLINYSTARTVTNPGGEPGIIYPVGLLYPLYGVYVLSVQLLALWNMWMTVQQSRQREQLEGKNTLRQEHRSLLLGGGLFMLGALYQVARVLLGEILPEWIGHLLLIGGLGFLGFSVAQFDMMMDGKNVKRDFLYSLSGIILINLAYLLILGVTGNLNPRSALLLVSLVTATHTLVDFGRELLDRLFFNRAEQEARSDARAFATAIAAEPVAIPTAGSVLALSPAEKQ